MGHHPEGRRHVRDHQRRPRLPRLRFGAATAERERGQDQDRHGGEHVATDGDQVDRAAPSVAVAEWHDRPPEEIYRCEPVRSGSLVALGEQAQLLQAAEVIQRRAEAIQQWPFQQRRLAQIAGIVGTVVTFVITGIISRLNLVRFGL